MTKKTPKPTPAHMKKLADLMDTRPEGVTVQRVQDTLQVSPPLAKAALIEIGAVEVEGKWVFEPELVTAESVQQEIIADFLAVHGDEPVTIDWPNSPDWANAAVMDMDGIWYWISKSHAFAGDLGWHQCGLSEQMAIAPATDTSQWRESKIQRTPDTCIDDMGIANFQKECQRVADQQAKSDFAVALEAERQRVFDAVANGGTVERIAELTGLHVDDVQMHLGVLIDDGAVVERPIIVAMSYGVAV